MFNSRMEAWGCAHMEWIESLRRRGGKTFTLIAHVDKV